MNRFWKFWKNYLLPLSIPISTITVIITICMLDSDSYIPTAICAFNLFWLLMVLWRNDGTKEKGRKRNGSSKNRR